MADDLELLRLRAKAKLKLQQEQGDSSHVPAAKPARGAFGSFMEGFGRQFQRVPAAIRGAVGAYQKSDAPGALDAAVGGFMDPESAPTPEDIAANAGFSREQREYTYNLPEMTMGRYVPNPTSTPITGTTSNAGVAGELMDMVTPTGLEFLPPGLSKVLGATGRGLEKAGLNNLRGAVKPSKALRRGPNPFNEENLFKSYDGKDLASMRGKGKTLENIQDFHDKLGDEADKLLETMPKVDLQAAVAEARQNLSEAIEQGLHQADAAKIQSALDNWETSASKLTPETPYSWLEGQGVEGKVAKNWRTSLADAARYDKPETNDGARIVAATIREALNEQLGKLSPQFRAIDKQFSETIPLRNALADAAGREGNKYPLGIRSAMMIANPASLPAKAAELALVEGTSRYIPAVITKRAGEAAAKASKKLPHPFSMMPLGQYLQAQNEDR